MPVWIRLLDLPPRLWTKDIIEKVVSMVGEPISIDFATIKRETLDGPRVQFKVDTSLKPRTEVALILPDGSCHT